DWSSDVCSSDLERRGPIQAAALLAGNVGELLDTACTDAAGREIDDAQPRCVVMRIVEQAQIGQRMLDLLALEEAQAAIHAVANARREQCVLDDPRLRIAAVQNRDLAAAAPLIDQRADLVEHPLGLEKIGGLLRNAYGLTVA